MKFSDLRSSARVVVSLFLFALLFSCTGDRENNDVYIGGYVQRMPDDSDKGHPDDYCAVYWLNGEPHSLGDGYESSAINAMELVNGDLYCAGYVRPAGGNNIAVYWKNGEEHRLTSGTYDAQVRGICVTDFGYVLCAGEEKDGPQQKRASTKYGTDYRTIREDVAKLWVNDSLSYAFSDGKLSASVSSVCVDTMGMVYMAGYDDWFFRRIASTYESYIEPRFWVNWEQTALWDRRGAANAVAWKNGSVYVGGWVVEGESGSEATYWQDGIRRELEDNYGGQVKSFCFEGPDVYMAGTNGYQDVKSAVYWKNGRIVPLLEDKYRSRSSCNTIAVLDGAVYCAGSMGQSAAYWKNGKVKLLGPGAANGIVVVRKKEEGK